MLPYERVREYLQDKLSLPVSVGSIANWNEEVYRDLEKTEQIIKQELVKSEILHADETGININGKRNWLHNASNEKWTALFPHKKRGSEAMDEMKILAKYTGVLCHDHWKPYYKYKHIIHSLCNAHHLRELQWVCDTEEKHKWAKEMQEFLLALNKKTIENGGILEKEEQERQRKEYRRILKNGDEECPLPPTKEPDKNGKKKRGRQKKTKARNLLERLRNFEDDVLRFMTRENIPFTNNLGERDIRMTKVQQKISGCFRSEQGAKIFCRIRSYLGSAKKQNLSPAFALQSLFEGKSVFSQELAE